VPIYLLHSQGDLLCEVSASKHFQSLHTNKLSKFVYTEQGKHELLQEATLWKVISLPTLTRAFFAKSYSFSEFPFWSDLLDGLPSPPRLVAYLVAHSSHCRAMCTRKKKFIHFVFARANCLWTSLFNKYHAHFKSLSRKIASALHKCGSSCSPCLL
jgi:hypothetical protein